MITIKLTKINILIIINVLVIIITFALAFFAGKNIYDEQKMQTYDIGENHRIGDVGVQITYDKEPVDIVLIDPDGREVHENQCKYYNQNNTQTLLTSTEMTGNWQAKWNTLSNKNIKYAFIEKPSEDLMISDITINPDEDNHKIKVTFTVAYKEPTDTDTDINYSIMCNNSEIGFSLPITDGVCKTNTPKEVVFSDTNLGNVGDTYTWTISINAYTNDKNKENIKAIKEETFTYTKKEPVKKIKIKKKKKKKSKKKDKKK